MGGNNNGNDKNDKVQWAVGSEDMVVMFIYVSDPSDGSKHTKYDLSKLTFTSGKEDDEIKENELTVTSNLYLNVDLNLASAPAPSFNINNYTYQVTGNSHVIDVDNAQRWIVESTADFFHPFHTHINPFMIKSIASDLIAGEYFSKVVLMQNTDYDEFPDVMWRDVVLIPPFGAAELWQRFNKRWYGKTVFHCHFLDHADMGMMSNLLLTFLFNPWAVSKLQGVFNTPGSDKNFRPQNQSFSATAVAKKNRIYREFSLEIFVSTGRPAEFLSERSRHTEGLVIHHSLSSSIRREN
eukprot:g2570.t1